MSHVGLINSGFTLRKKGCQRAACGTEYKGSHTQSGFRSEKQRHTMRHQCGVACLRDAPRTPLLPAVSSGADSELIIDIGVYV